VRILTVVHDYLPAHLGGSELHAHQLSAELARRGHEVTALFTERDLSREEGSTLRGELDGVRTVELVHQREYQDVRETWEQTPAVEAFEALLAELRPEVVHFHHLSLWGARCVERARAAGCRVVVTLHDYHSLCDSAVLLRRDLSLCDGAEGCTDCLRRHPMLTERHGGDAAPEDERWLRAAAERRAHNATGLVAAHRIIAPSRYLAGVFRRAGMATDEQLVVMKAGYPGELRAPRTSDPSRPLRVCYIGGIYPSKGVHVLVGAFRHVDPALAELSVHGILEWFPGYVEELRAQADGRPVRFRGSYDPGDVDTVLAEADVVCVPSIWVENQPITIQEAYRNGLPVVATDLGGMAEAVEHGRSGLVFPRGDERALAAALTSLAEDRGLLARLAAGRPRVPTVPEIADGVLELYAGG
jgi:glycosyltransferase involved in cell wall biosynthesis